MKSARERDLNDIRVFVRVVQAQSFSAAGRSLGVPTSTVSRRVSRLEEALGVRLLQRTTRKLSLTDAGQVYYENGVSIFEALEDAENVISEAQEVPTGRLRIAAPAEHSVTIRLVNDFLDLHPKVVVDLELTGRSVNILEEGFDASIHAGELPSLSVVAHKLLDSPFKMVASPRYLDARGVPTDVAQLREHDCIIFGSSTRNAYWSLRSGRELKRVALRGRVAVNHLDGVRQAALAGHGLALLPLLSCADDIEATRLQPVLEMACPPAVPIYVTYSPGRFQRPALRAFVQHVRSHFPNLIRSRSRARGKKRK